MSPHSLPRLIFINRYFHPDQSATSRLLSDLAFALADAGHDILILTSQQRYDDPDARLPACEVRGRVKVHRLAGTRFGRMRLLGRAIDYLSFYVSMAVTLFKLARAGDTIVPMTDPPMLGLFADPIARRKGCRIINWLQDLYPEVALAVGTPFLRPIVAKLIKAFRDRALRAADCNVVIATAMAERVSTLDVKKERIRNIKLPLQRPELGTTLRIDDRLQPHHRVLSTRDNNFFTRLGARDELGERCFGLVNCDNGHGAIPMRT